MGCASKLGQPLAEILAGIILFEVRSEAFKTAHAPGPHMCPLPGGPAVGACLCAPPGDSESVPKDSKQIENIPKLECLVVIGCGCTPVKIFISPSASKNLSPAYVHNHL